MTDVSPATINPIKMRLIELQSEITIFIDEAKAREQDCRSVQEIDEKRDKQIEENYSRDDCEAGDSDYVKQMKSDEIWLRTVWPLNKRIQSLKAKCDKSAQNMQKVFDKISIVFGNLALQCPTFQMRLDKIGYHPILKAGIKADPYNALTWNDTANFLNLAMGIVKSLIKELADISNPKRPVGRPKSKDVEHFNQAVRAFISRENVSSSKQIVSDVLRKLAKHLDSIPNLRDNDPWLAGLSIGSQKISYSKAYEFRSHRPKFIKRVKRAMEA